MAFSHLLSSLPNHPRDRRSTYFKNHQEKDIKSNSMTCRIVHEKQTLFTLFEVWKKILQCSEFLYKTRLGTSIYSQFLSTCSTIGKLFVIYLNSFLSTTQNCSLRAKRRATRESGYCAPASLLGYWEISRTAFYWWREKGSKEEKGRWNESYKEIGRTH